MAVTANYRYRGCSSRTLFDKGVAAAGVAGSQPAEGSHCYAVGSVREVSQGAGRDDKLGLSSAQAQPTTWY